MANISTCISGVCVYPKRRIIDSRGAIFHMLRVDDPEFENFGEIYFSRVNPGIVKGWHLHHKMSLNYLVVVGHILIVIYDDRQSSETRGSYLEIELSAESGQLVHIPPLVWNGFKGLGDEPSIIANCATLAHSPEEIERLSIFDSSFHYDWMVDKGLPHG